MGVRHGDIPWGQAECQQAVALFLNGLTPAEIAQHAAFQGRRDKDAIRMKLKSLGYTARGLRKGDTPPDPDIAAVVPSKLQSVLTLPPTPFAVPVPAPASKVAGRFTTAVLYGDTHVPFQDDAALKVVQAVIRDVRPDILVHMGDLVDCWQISRFDKDPSRLDTLQENIDAARAHLHQMATIAPQAQRVLLEGNHEARLHKVVWRMENPSRELARLTAVQQALQWPNLLQLDGIGWRWVSEREQSRTKVLPHGITKHGTAVRKWSGWSAKAEWEKYGRSGFSGHTHRLGYFVHRDHNGHASWIETGCTCKLDAEYGVDFDWGHGCVVVTWSQDGFIQNTEFVSIREGRALWRTQEYGV